MTSSPNRSSKGGEKDGESRFSKLVNDFFNSQNDKSSLSSCFQYYSKRISGCELTNRIVHSVTKLVDYFAVEKKSLIILEDFQEVLYEMINAVYTSGLLTEENQTYFFNSISELILNIISSTQENSNYSLFLNSILTNNEISSTILSPNNVSDLFKILFSQKQKKVISIFLLKTREFNVQNEKYIQPLHHSLKLIQEDKIRHLSSAFEFLGNIAICQKKKNQFFEDFFHLIEEKSTYLKSFNFLSRYFNILNDISNQTMINIIKKDGSSTIIQNVLSLITEIEDKELINVKLILKMASLKMPVESQKILLDQFIIFAYCYENSEEILSKYFKKLMPFWKNGINYKILFELMNQFENNIDQICSQFLIDVDQDKFCEILKSDADDIEFLCQSINIVLYKQVSHTDQLINLLIYWEENKINCEQFFQALFKNKENAEKAVQPFLSFCQMNDPNKYVFTFFSRYATRRSGFLEGFMHNNNLEIFFSHLNTFPAVDFLASLAHKIPKNEKIEWYSKTYYEKSILKKLSILQLTKLMYGLWPVDSKSIKVEYEMSDEKICIQTFEVKIFLHKIKNKDISNYLNSADLFDKFYKLVLNATCDIESLIKYLIDLCENEKEIEKEKMKKLFEAVLFKKSHNCEISVKPLIDIISSKHGQIKAVIFESYIEFASHQKKFVVTFCQPKNLEIYCSNLFTIESIDLLASVSSVASSKHINLIEPLLVKNFENSILSKLDQRQLYLFSSGLSQNSKEKPEFLIFECFKDKFSEEEKSEKSVELMKLLLSNNNEIEIRIENGDKQLRNTLFKYFEENENNVEYSILRVIQWAEKGCEVVDFFEILLVDKNAVKCVNPFISFLAKRKTMCNLTYNMYTKKLAHNSDFVSAFLTDRNLSVFFNALNTTAGVNFLAAIASNGPFDQIDKFVSIYFKRSVLSHLNDQELLNFIFGLPHDNDPKKTGQNHETVFIRNVFSDPFNKEKKYIIRCDEKEDRILKIGENATINDAIQIIFNSLMNKKVDKIRNEMDEEEENIKEEEEDKEDINNYEIEICNIDDYSNRDDLFNQLNFDDNIVVVSIKPK